MILDKQKYFISVGQGEISRIPYQGNDDFVIYATAEEILMLRRKFEGLHEASFDSYKRTHIPFVPYHLDTANDVYDDTMAGVYQTLYDLGDENTKDHIRTMGILGEE
ncbi:hydrolase [Oceanobacillus timonensis]|uniref:hydrolase n=1 Tax=Oceanobacillus timonensis TaxID=1926285 RepID=UPI001FE8650E|nr:hydrolase [Oceanobacillus timonensis]